MNKTVLVLGGNGFIGRNLCTELSKSDKVISYDISKNTSNYSDVIQFQGFLTEIEKIRQIVLNERIDTIVHCVSTIIPKSGLDEYYKEVENVYLPTISIIKLCCEYKIRFIYLSSGGVLYETSERKHKEDDTIKPLSFYALSKFNIEEAVKLFHHQFGLEYVILRPSNPYGYGQSLYKNQGLIANVFGKIVSNKPIEIWGDGNEIRDYIYISDFVTIVSTIVNRIQIKNIVLNIGAGIGVSVNAVVNIVESIVGHPLEKINKNSEKSIIKSNVLDVDLLNSYIDIKLVDITKGISMFYEKLKKEKIIL